MPTTLRRLTAVLATVLLALALGSGALPAHAASKSTTDAVGDQVTDYPFGDVRAFAINNAPNYVVMTIRLGGTSPETSSTLASLYAVGSKNKVYFVVGSLATGFSNDKEFRRNSTTPHGHLSVPVECAGLKAHYIPGNRFRISFPQTCLGNFSGTLRARAITRSPDGDLWDRSYALTVTKG